MKRKSRISQQQHTVLSTIYHDVTGDELYDRIELVGTPDMASGFIRNIGIVVKNTRTGETIEVFPTYGEGYSPSLFVGDFTGDGIKDVFLTINSGGSGATTFDYIYSFVNNKPEIVFDFEQYNREFSYEITYENNYKVRVRSNQNNLDYIIDISYKGEEYLNQLYDENGILKKPVQGFVNPLSALFPVDLEGDNVYELMAFQKIAGLYNADGLGYIQNFLTLAGDENKLFNQYVAIFGNCSDCNQK